MMLVTGARIPLRYRGITIVKERSFVFRPRRILARDGACSIARARRM